MRLSRNSGVTFWRMRIALLQDLFSEVGDVPSERDYGVKGVGAMDHAEEHGKLLTIGW